MGDVFSRRCTGCSAIIGLREGCAACADRRRAELRARPDAKLGLVMNRIDGDFDCLARREFEWAGERLIRALTAPARWAAQGVAGRLAARRAARDAAECARVVNTSCTSIGFVLANDPKETRAKIEPAKPRYVDASEVRVGDTIRGVGGVTGRIYRGRVELRGGVLVIAADEDRVYWSWVEHLRDIEMLDRAK